MNPMPGFYKHSAPLEPGTGWGESRGSTNSRLRWSREPVGRNLAVLQTFGSAGAGNGLGIISRFYKHSAPLEPGGDGNACVLQTFGSAGAGRRRKCLRATNIRLRWSREPVGGNLAVLQTFGSAGAGNRLGVISRFYKHSAPLEPRTGWG